MKIKDIKNRSIEIRSQSEGKYRVKWPKDFKIMVLNLLDSGENIASICKATGISQPTIDRWSSAAKTKKNFREINLKDDTPTGLTLRLPGNIEVHGLTFNQIGELLKRGIL